MMYFVVVCEMMILYLLFLLVYDLQIWNKYVLYAKGSSKGMQATQSFK